MTTANVLCNLTNFMGAGYDTSANTLSLTIHNLAHNPDVQAKMLQVWHHKQQLLRLSLACF